MDVPLTDDHLVEQVAEALYNWDRLMFTRMADRYGAARIAVDTLRKISEELEANGRFIK